MTLVEYRELNAVNETGVLEILNIEAVHEKLEEMRLEVADGNKLRRKRAQSLHKAKTNVLPINIAVGDYVEIHSPAERKHKLEAT